MMVRLFGAKLEKNILAYHANRDSGFYPMAIARGDRYHAEEVANKIMDARERRNAEITLTVDDRWLQ